MKYGFITVAAAVPSVKVADTEYNVKQIEDFVAQAEGKGVEIIVFQSCPLRDILVKICSYSNCLLSSRKLL